MRIALCISYQGNAYHGWQAHVGLKTIQSQLEEAVGNVANHSVVVTCAGRTDKGVHALEQVVHFDSLALRAPRAWLLGCNHYLPPDIRVNWVQFVPSRFHARFSAVARRYCYIIYNHPVSSAFWNQGCAYYYKPLDEVAMQLAANYFVGEHDFSSFRASSCQSKSSIRCVEHIKVLRHQAYIVIDIQANAFLHHMVRNIVGVLMCIGSGNREPQWARDVLLAKDRKKASITAASNGLYLVRVIYKENFSKLFSRKSFTYASLPPLASFLLLKEFI